MPGGEESRSDDLSKKINDLTAGRTGRAREGLWKSSIELWKLSISEAEGEPFAVYEFSGLLYHSQHEGANDHSDEPVASLLLR